MGRVPSWIDYGTNDPGKHDPSKAATSVVSLGATEIPMGLHDTFMRRPLGFRLDWADASMSTAARRDFAQALFEYIAHSTAGYL